MTLFDTMDGYFKSAAYGWAFAPVSLITLTSHTTCG
jgi:high-affinity nickel permease